MGVIKNDGIHGVVGPNILFGIDLNLKVHIWHHLAIAQSPTDFGEILVRSQCLV